MEPLTAIETDPVRRMAAPADRPLRVLHVASGDLWAGAEAQIYTLVRALMSLVPDIQLRAALMNEGELAGRLRESGVDVHIFDESQLGSIGIFTGLRRLMRVWRPDIVHTHRTKENILASLANTTTCRAPSVRTSHGASERTAGGMRGLREALVSRIDLWCARRLQRRVIAVSAELAKHLVGTFPAEKIAVIENGVDVAETRARVHPVDFRSHFPDDVHIGLAGRLVPVKRVDLFIRTAAVLQGRFPQMPWHFHVFGDGPLRPQLEKQAMLEAGLRITFHGHRPDIISCLAALGVLVMCSDHEGLPMTVLEALAVGTRIVAHAVGGLTESLSGVDSAILVQEHHPTAYAEAVWRLLSLPVRTGEEKAIPERIRAARTATLTYSLYRELLSQGIQSRWS